MFFNVFYCGFILSRILILLNFPDYWEQKSNFTSHFKYKIHTCHECDKYPKPSVTCHLTHVSSTRKILQKKDWGIGRRETGEELWLCWPRTGWVYRPGPQKATQGYRGLHRATEGSNKPSPGNSRVQSKTQNLPTTQTGGPWPIQPANQLTKQPITHAIPIHVTDQEPTFFARLVSFVDWVLRL